MMDLVHCSHHFRNVWVNPEFIQGSQGGTADFHDFGSHSPSFAPGRAPKIMEMPRMERIGPNESSSIIHTMDLLHSKYASGALRRRMGCFCASLGHQNDFRPKPAISFVFHDLGGPF